MRAGVLPHQEETPETLRRLIAGYRERLDRGGNFDTVNFCLERIREAEAKLVELEARASG